MILGKIQYPMGQVSFWIVSASLLQWLGLGHEVCFFMFSFVSD